MKRRPIHLAKIRQSSAFAECAPTTTSSSACRQLNLCVEYSLLDYVFVLVLSGVDDDGGAGRQSIMSALYQCTHTHTHYLAFYSVMLFTKWQRDSLSISLSLSLPLTSHVHHRIWRGTIELILTVIVCAMRLAKRHRA